MSKPFDWRKHLQVHPAADLFPLLPPAELKDLADDIKVRGLQTPIVLSWGGRLSDPTTLLDGRNRLDALALLGWLEAPEPRKPREKVANYAQRVQLHPFRVLDYSDVPGDDGDFEYDYENHQAFDITTPDDPYAIALSLNVRRRHLTAEQKRELIAKVLKAKPEQSNLTIAKQVKADDKTVAKVRRDLEATSEIPKLEKTVGADGKARKAKLRRLELREEKIGQENLQSVLLMNSAASVQCATYEGPVDAKIINACRRAADAWENLALSLEEEHAGHQNNDAPEEDSRGFILAVIDTAAQKANIARRNLKHVKFEDDAQEVIIGAVDRLFRKWESFKRKVTLSSAPNNVKPPEARNDPLAARRGDFL